MDPAHNVRHGLLGLGLHSRRTLPSRGGQALRGIDPQVDHAALARHAANNPIVGPSIRVVSDSGYESRDRRPVHYSCISSEAFTAPHKLRRALSIHVE